MFTAYSELNSTPGVLLSSASQTLALAIDTQACDSFNMFVACHALLEFIGPFKKTKC